MQSETLRRDRLMRFPPLLRAGFRPFFLGGAAWALVVIVLWLGMLRGDLTLPTHLDPLAWHRHEMLFGYLGAVVTGFMLTAIPNWTGRLPLSGGRLAALSALWILARLAVLFSARTGMMLAVLLDVGFLTALAFVAWREILAAKNRNYPVCFAASLLALASALDHAEALGAAALAGIGWRLGFAVLLLLVALIGGRIIPSFTRNWLTKQGRTEGLPDQPNRFDMAAIAVTALALGGWAVWPDSRLAGALLAGAGVLQLVRLARWSGGRTMREPLLLMLHVSFLWLPVGLLLLGGNLFIPAIPVSAALHALAAGALASMTLAVMARATLGHTGRALTSNMSTSGAYILLTLGALVRVLAPVLPMDYMLAIQIAGGLWGSAFLLFLIAYGPKLIGSRPDGKP